MIVDIFTLIWMHFVADFILQTDEMAKKKSKNNKWLAYHITVYSAPFLYFGWQFAAINWAAHFCTDWCTSRLSSKLYAKGQIHWFFVVIGFDQAVHMTTLIGTYLWLMP